MGEVKTVDLSTAASDSDSEGSIYDKSVGENDDICDKSKPPGRLESHSISPVRINSKRQLWKKHACLIISEAVLNQWHHIKYALGLKNDTELAAYLIQRYESSKSTLQTSSSCKVCQASLVLFCTNCNLLAHMSQQEQLAIQPSPQESIANQSLPQDLVDIQPNHQKQIAIQSLHQEQLAIQPSPQEPIANQSLHQDPVTIQTSHQEPIDIQPRCQGPISFQPSHQGPVFIQSSHLEPVAFQHKEKASYSEVNKVTEASQTTRNIQGKRKVKKEETVKVVQTDASAEEASGFVAIEEASGNVSSNKLLWAAGVGFFPFICNLYWKL